MTFINGLGLVGAGLAAMAIPIIIHILNRRRYKIVRWAAIDFLLQAQRTNKKRIQMEHFIVLLLRCLAVALIAMAVARPAATRGALGNLPGARDQVERIVILDDSASTSESEGDRTAYDEAKRLVYDPTGNQGAPAGLIADLARDRPLDLVTIVRGSRARQPDLVRSEAKSGRTEEVARRIASWQPSHTRFAIADAVRAAVVTQTAKDKAAGLKRYAYVLTDLRKQDWQLEGVDASNALAQAFRDAGAEVQYYLIDVGHSNVPNVGVSQVVPQEKLVTAGIPQKLVATVTNFGKTTAREVRVGLAVGATTKLQAPSIPELKPGESKEVEIAYTFAEAGPFAATVQIAADGDRMPLDDVRDVALEVRRAVRVLLIDGRPTDDPYESQTFFLERALQPAGEVKSGVEAVSIPVERLPELDLSSARGGSAEGSSDVIVACDLDRWPRERVAALERYVREGGGLAIFLGDEVDPAFYDRVLWKDGQGLLPCKLGELVTEPTPVKLTAPAMDHPLLRFFQGENNPLLSRVKTRKRFTLPIDPRKDATSTVVARWESVGNVPAIVEKRPFAKEGGKGRVVLFNVSSNRAWTDWPREVSFLVVAQELVRHLAAASTEGANLQVGEPILRAINPAAFEPKARLFLPGELAKREGGHELLAAKRPDDPTDALWFTYPGTVQAGVYGLELQPRAAGATARVESFAVELDPREGDLEKADPQVLAKTFQGINVTFGTAKETKSLLVLTEGEKRELWRTCAFVLLAILALEGVLSWIAAHHGSAASADEVEAARGMEGEAEAPRVTLPTAGPAPIGLPVAGGKT